MISNNTKDYKDADEWLALLKSDEVFLNRQHLMETEFEEDAYEALAKYIGKAKAELGEGLVAQYWDLYNHDILKTVREVWETITLVKLKLEVVAMLTLEWIARNHGDMEVCEDDPRNKVVRQLMPMFYNSKSTVLDYLDKIDGCKPKAVVGVTNDFIKDGRLKHVSCKKELYTVLYREGFYKLSYQNWCSQVN